MKRMLFGFVLGMCVGAFAYWYYDQPSTSGHVTAARSSATGAADRVKSVVQSTIGEVRTEDIKRELERIGVVVREKLTKAGEAISDATVDARTTGAIKAKLLKAPGIESRNISVDTTDGLVTLSGTVRSHEEVTKAVRLALETEGVRKVVSTLQVKPVQ